MWGSKSVWSRGDQGLPFVPRPYLREFLQCFEAEESYTTAPSKVTALDFFEEFFIHQEELYHTLLGALDEVYASLNVWLNWTSPVRHSPYFFSPMLRYMRSAHQTTAWSVSWAAHSAYQAYGRLLAAEGSRDIVKGLSHMHDTLCRMIAFIQMSSFELLTLRPTNAALREQAVGNAMQILRMEAEATLQAAQEVPGACSHSSDQTAGWPSTPSAVASVASQTAVAVASAASQKASVASQKVQVAFPSLAKLWGPLGSADRNDGDQSDGSTSFLARDVLRRPTLCDDSHAHFQKSRVGVRNYVNSIRMHLNKVRYTPSLFPRGLRYICASAVVARFAWTLQNKAARMAWFAWATACVTQFFTEWMAKP